MAAGRLERLHAGVIHASRVLSWIAVGALLLVCGAVLIDVALRWTLNYPLHGLEDVTALVITIAVAACFPAGFGLKTNIAVRVVGRSIGPRATAWLEVFGEAVACAFVVLAAWQLVVYAGDVVVRKSLILGLPIAPAWRIAACLLVLAAVVQVVVMVVELAAAWRGRPLADAIADGH
jgi:TRAP-type C4-dicarboxylate transport system permease small subunit